MVIRETLAYRWLIRSAAIRTFRVGRWSSLIGFRDFEYVPRKNCPGRHTPSSILRGISRISCARTTSYFSLLSRFIRWNRAKASFSELPSGYDVRKHWLRWGSSVRCSSVSLTAPNVYHRFDGICPGNIVRRLYSEGLNLSWGWSFWKLRHVLLSFRGFCEWVARRRELL